MELISDEVPTEALESEFIQLRRRRQITARGVRLAEEMMERADRGNQAVVDRLAAVEAALEARYYLAAAEIGDEPAAVLQLEE